MDEVLQSRGMVRWGQQRRAVRIVLGLALGLVLVVGMPLAGQSPYPQFPSTNDGKAGQHFPDANEPFGKEPPLDAKRMSSINAQRHKELVSDTDKLLKLTRELNAEISDGNDSGMTDAQLHKVAEIAKLARSIKEKMSFSFGAYPGLNSAPPFDKQ